MLLQRAREHARRLSLLAATALTGLLAATPAAHAQLTQILPVGSGLTMPAGIADAGGDVWISDGVLGVCKVDAALGTVVKDGTYCGPGHAGPAAPLQMAYDPATSSLFVADGASSSTGVWKLTLAGGAISTGAKIFDAGDRVFGLALGTAGGRTVLDFTSKSLPLVQRITDPGTCTGTQCRPAIVGSALDKGGLSLAHVGDALYIAEEAFGVTRIANPGPSGGIAAPVAGFPAGIPTALAADSARGRLYAGTTNGNGLDQVDVLNTATGARETYAAGLAGVGALSVRSDGSLLIGDDAGTGAEVTGTGRLSSVPLMALNRPVVTITADHAVFSNGRTGSFQLSGPDGATFECRLDPADALAAWLPCGAAPLATVGTQSLGLAGHSLSEGAHVLEARAVSSAAAIGAGPVQRHTFVIDRTAPSVFVDNRDAEAQLVGVSAMTMRFSSTDAGARFVCSLDGAAPVPCSDPMRYTGLALGDHVSAVAAPAAAGNSSMPATFRFVVRPAPAGNAAPVLAPPAVAGSGPSRTALEPHLSTSLRPRYVALARSRISARKLRRARRIKVRLNAPVSARVAVLSLWRTTKRSVGGGHPPLAFGSVRLSRAGRNDVSLTLTPKQVAGVRRGAYLLGVSLTNGADAYGPTRFRRLYLIR